MADFTSHLLSSYQILSTIRNNINIDNNSDNSTLSILTTFKTAYYIGSQGPDILFYNKPVIHKSVLSKLGSKLHRTDLMLQLRFLLKYQQTLSDKTTRHILLAYICGYISHYNLDVLLHPLIGHFVRMSPINSRRTATYFHTQYESQIDIAMCQLILNKDIKCFDISNFCDNDNDMAQYDIISKAYAYMLKNIFEYIDSNSEIITCIKTMLTLNRLFYKKGLLYALAKIVAIKKPEFLMHFKQYNHLNPCIDIKYINSTTGVEYTRSISTIFSLSAIKSANDILLLFDNYNNDTIDNFYINDAFNFENGL